MRIKVRDDRQLLRLTDFVSFFLGQSMHPIPMYQLRIFYSFKPTQHTAKNGTKVQSRWTSSIVIRLTRRGVKLFIGKCCGL